MDYNSITHRNLQKYLDSVRADGEKNLSHIKRICLLKHNRATQVLQLGFDTGGLIRISGHNGSHIIRSDQGEDA